MSMLTTLDGLKKARELISDPSRWTQGENARDANGYATDPHDESATCFCLGGAIAHVFGGFGEPGIPEAQNCLSAAAKTLLPEGYRPLLSTFVDINDGVIVISDELTPHQAALKVIDIAIEKAQEGHCA